MKLRNIGVALVVAAVGALALPTFASEAPNTIQVESVVLAEGGAELQVKLMDREAVNAACDYSVTRMEFIEAASLLMVDLRSPEPCLLDRIGRRAGILKWNLPAALRGTGKINVILNQAKFGRLVIKGTEVEFRAVK